MTYRVNEIEITGTYSEYKIERKFLWFWINQKIDEQYLTSAKEASTWIQLKEHGFDPQRFYYES